MPRREDLKFLTGQGRYLDDLTLPGTLHAAILRSPHAHARIWRVDTSRARALPGVRAVLTGEEVVRQSRPMRSLIPVPVNLGYYCMAHGKVRSVGEPVAAVAAVDRYTAEDALERIEVEYEPLPAAVDPEVAMARGAPLLYEELGSNVLWHDTFHYGDVEAAFRQADEVFRERFTIHRYASTPLETFGVLASYDAGSDAVTIWCNDQRPGLTLGLVADALGIPQARVRLIAPDIGGGFGNKRRAPYLVLVALLARAAGRPVKWVEDRRENLLALAHACNGILELEAAVRRDGTILGLRLRDIADEGSNLANPTVHCLLKLGNIVNCYRIPAVTFEAHSVLTNKCPSGANRGIGKPFMCFALERSMDLIAQRLGLDPAEIRFRNLIPPEAFPYRIPTGTVFDSGDYPATLRKALELAGYPEARAEQAEARKAGRYLGIGIAVAVEPSSSNLSSYILTTGRQLASGMGEAASVRVEPDGTVRVATGDIGSGQGYETTLSQIVADELAVEFDDVHVVTWFDSYTNPWIYASGNYSNKFSGTDTAAVLGAASKVKAKLLALGAHLLGVPAEHVELRNGRVVVIGEPDRSRALAEIARIAYRDLLSLPKGMEAGLEASCYHINPLADLPDEQRRVRTQLFASNAAHIALVEVDPETAQVRVRRYIVVHDCGTEINPMIVEGLVHGATTHGIGAALLEEFVYDEHGQLLTTSFMDYLKPTATDVPRFETGHLETPSPFTPLGSKGVGEGGAIPAPAAIANAVEDALRPLGVKVNALPLSPDRLFRLIQAARRAEPGAVPPA